jgi:para-aminobenzoate synthetase
MRCLIIDNYDSFTWNLAHYVAEEFGTMPTVVYNDKYSWEELIKRYEFDCIIVSPGPGSVTNDADFHASRQALLQETIPVFGVCLGLQGLAHVHGGEIVRASIPFHGRSSDIRHYGDPMFAGIPEVFSAVRYHSLVVAPSSLPSSLSATAHTADNILMAIRHRSLPKWGVQFHPESLLTEYGHRMIRNFRDLAHAAVGQVRVQVPPRAELEMPPCVAQGPRVRAPMRLLARRIDHTPDAEDVFMDLFAWEENAFWLDSAMVKEGLSRFSFMGKASADDVRIYKLCEDTPDHAGGRAYLDALERDLEGAQVSGGEELPFAFRGGWVGYFTYEMKAVFGACPKKVKRGTTPDAAWMFANKFLAFDHAHNTVWAVAVVPEGEESGAEIWLNNMERYLPTVSRAEAVRVDEAVDRLRVHVDQGHDDYLASIDICKQKILAGESYEICLTNHFSIDTKVDPLALYRTLRRRNPAPFGAYVKCGGATVLSTSPERFLEVNASGLIQAKPIKGTIARVSDPREDRLRAYRLRKSEKDIAENLMIVDLMRNDMSRVSTVGSVTVDKLMDIETYTTLHHMVSTVEAQLAPERSLMDLVRATFPGGSISGAPKIRTMEIIDDLENQARGVYCGSIGYLGFNRVADLNIAIRTMSYDGHTLHFGAGGAITYLSKPEDEFNEIMAKARAVIGPIWHHLSASDRAFEWQLDGQTLHLYATPVETPCSVS